MAQKQNKTKYKIVVLILIVIEVIWFGSLLLHGRNIAILNPQGPIATQQRNLIITAVLLMLAVVIPVFATTFYIAYKYREGNKKLYDPNHNFKFKMIWWIIPSLVVLVLAPLTWNSAHALDPSRKIVSDKKPITIQVVALSWKWLFIYPDSGIATINFVEFPANTPINFEITADAPMNSFWIPQLGGQMYAMPGMSTKHHLMADTEGEFAGSAAEINGRGFAGMKFIAKSTSQTAYESWVESMKKTSNYLGPFEYNNLALPSENNPQAIYYPSQPGLFTTIIEKYLPPGSGGGHGH